MSAEAHRLTPTERLHEVTMAAMTREPAPPESSSSRKRNSKGVWEAEFVVRHADPFEADRIANELAAQFDLDFPYANGSE